jgi:diguanylate cyclase (GGDEF)-like protein
MIDVDHFKKINDTYGHLAGDDVLRTLAAVVKTNIRKTDSFGRWGGEEFMVLAPETAGEEASELAEKIRRVLGTHPFEKAGAVTVSCGITQFRKKEDLNSFIKRADDALYRAKDQGRNRVVVEK